MWTTTPEALTAHFTFPDFSSAFAFMTEVAAEAERLNHHPEWTNIYNQVSIRLSTHDAGNTVTAADRELAERIAQIATKYPLQ